MLYNILHIMYVKIVGFEFGRIPGLSSSTPRGTKVSEAVSQARSGSLWVYLPIPISYDDIIFCNSVGVC